MRKRGRPATGRDPVVAVRLPRELIAAIDGWGAANGIGRSEAIRRLVELTMTRNPADTADTELIGAIDAWIAAQAEPRPNRQKAIRLLVTLGLKAARE